MAWTPEQKHETDKTISNGRWMPCNDAIQVGTFTSASSGITNMLLNQSYRVFTHPKPFNWYVFGFAANWTQEFLVDTLIDVADMGERENMTTRFMNAAELLGRPNQHVGGYMPLQCGQYEIEGVHKAWAWGTVETDESETGISFWHDRDRGAKFLAPYMLKPGHQLRFIVQNRCEEDFPNTILTVIGQRWLPWEGESQFKYQ